MRDLRHPLRTHKGVHSIQTCVVHKRHLAQCGTREIVVHLGLVPVRTMAKVDHRTYREHHKEEPQSMGQQCG